MLKKIGLAVALTAIATPAFFAGPAFAQGVAAPIELTVTTPEGVLAACTVPGATQAACNAAIASYFAYLDTQGVVGAARESAIANLVVALAEANVTPAVRVVVVAAIRLIGTTYASGDQAAAILQIALALEQGQPIQTGALSGSAA